jgi:hypothetical protein
MSFETKFIIVKLRDNQQRRVKAQIRGHLAYHLTVKERKDKSFTVTHIASGKALVVPVTSEDFCRQFVEVMGTHPDWLSLPLLTTIADYAGLDLCWTNYYGQGIGKSFQEYAGGNEIYPVEKDS